MRIDPARTDCAQKLLIVGVDAGSPTLFRQWCAAGDLPNLQRLMKNGQTRAVENPYALEAGSVWPVFHSGLMPGRQPQYDGRRAFVPEDYSLRWYGPDETPPTVWRQLSDQGVRCLLIDPPYTLVDRSINGTMIVDWGGHVPANGQRFELQTQPAEVAEEVLAVVGPDPAGAVMCDRMGPETVADHRRFRDTYLRRIELKGKLASHMLEHKPWDLALVASSDLHCTGHHLGHVNDRGHPRYSPRLEAALGEPLRDCYRAFDRALGTIMSSVGPDTTVMFYGSHGMGPSYSGTGLLDRILLRLDKGRPGSSHRSLRGHLRNAWKSVPEELRGHLRPLRRHFRGVLRPPQLMGSQQDRRFFEVYANNATGGVRLNLRGREGSGTVEPDEAEDVIRFLIDEISKIVNSETGEPLVEDVIATGDWYQGPHVGRMPDLLVRWNRSAPIRSIRSDAIGELSHEYLDNRTGDHTPEGFCVISGPGVEPGVEAEAVRTADFAPSIAACFGRELQSHDGRAFQLAGVAQPA
jgi:predicted AlkP superfamily phosphohydrolase/phosphomutase